MRELRNSGIKIKRIVFLVIGLAIAVSSFCQSIVPDQYKSYGLAIDSLNVIQNKSHLDEFYESLYQLRRGAQRKINIVHIGDSHIQADFLTKTVRNNFQKHFGNAGRGLIVPGRVAGTNEPFNIQTSSNVTWETKRIVHPDHHLPIGVGGITIRSGVPKSRLYVYMNDQTQDYSFQKVTIFHLKNGSSFGLTLKDNEFKTLKTLMDNDTIRNITTLRLESLKNSIVIESTKQDSSQNHTTLFGISLENENAGILYHVIGVNGAKYAHYNAAKLFASQTHLLDPALFIISLGTNESLDYPNIDRRLFTHIENLVSSLRANNPLAKIILVTPPECFMKKTRNNPGILKVRDAIIQFAVENGLAFYDMHQALGGEGAAGRWKEVQLLRADGVHFSKEGYDYQGNLLFHAILKGYNDYVPVRHP